MFTPLYKTLAAFSLFAACCASADAALKVDPIFGVGDTTDFPGSVPITKAANAATVEASIDAAVTQVESLISNSFTFKINFVDDPNTDLGASVDTGSFDLPYHQYVADLEANTSKSAYDTSALYYLPKTAGSGINKNSTEVNIVAPLLDAIGDTAAGNSLIAQNGGYIGTIALNLSAMNLSRKSDNPNDYDLESVVMHEVDECLGIGGTGSTLGGTATNVGVMDLFRYSAAGVKSYTGSSTAVSYFSITGGKTDLVHFNQSPDGDYGDWGDGVTPADDQGNTPPQVQDGFGDPGTQPNMGRNEAIALDVTGWNLTTAGLDLEEGKTAATAQSAASLPTSRLVLQAVPEPADYACLLLGALALIPSLRPRRNAA